MISQNKTLDIRFESLEADDESGSEEASGAQRGYLKCSIRGTNNQLPIEFHKFVYLQLFNVKYKFVHLQLLDYKFLFSEKHIFCKQERTKNQKKYKSTAVYGCMSLVSDLKLAQENDDLLSSRHKYIFEVPHNMQF